MAADQTQNRSASFTLTRWLLILNIVVSGVCVVSDAAQLQLLRRARTEARPSKEELRANDSRQAMLRLVRAALRFPTGIAFLWWFFRVHKNLLGLGWTADRLTYRSDSAVIGFFIPFVNLVRPYQMMMEVWEKSDPHPAEARQQDSAVVGWWWGGYLLSGVLTSAAALMLLQKKHSFDQFVGLSWLQLIANFTVIPAGLLAITVVQRIDRRQHERRVSESVLGAVFD